MKTTLLLALTILALVLTLSSVSAATYVLCNSTAVTPAAGRVTNTYTMAGTINSSDETGTKAYKWYCNTKLISGQTSSTIQPSGKCLGGLVLIGAINCSNSTHAGSYINATGVTLSGYSYGAYTANDISAIFIDLVGNYGVALISFISLIAIAALYIYLKKRV